MSLRNSYGFLLFNLWWRLSDHTKCSLFFPQDTKSDSKNAKKKNNKKTSKNKSSLSRANKKKPGMPNVSNDLSQKLYATMEKHKEVLQSQMMHYVLSMHFIAVIYSCVDKEMVSKDFVEFRR